MTSEVRAELERLLSELCDGELSAEQHARLEELLESAECRRFYLEYIDMHAGMLVRPQPIGTAEPTAKPAAARPRARMPQSLRYVVVAATTLAASLLVQAWWFGPAPPRANSAVPGDSASPGREYVATLTRAAETVWGLPSDSPRVGSRLMPGEFRLKEGIARVRFDSGAELLFEGLTVLRLDSSDEATVLQGKVIFRGSEMSAPFRLRTPTSILVDLGTEYAVVVGSEGEEVYVLDGEVQRTASDNPSGSQHLAAGEGRRYDAAPNSAGVPVKFDPAQFRRLMGSAEPPARPQQGLLAYEGFIYEKPEVLIDGMADGGTGWTSPWRAGFARPRNPEDENVLALNVQEGLSRPGAQQPVAGGAFDYTGFTKYFRQMATPIRMDADAVYYLSFLVRRDGPPEERLNSSAILLRTSEELRSEHEGQDNRRERLNIGVAHINDLFTSLHGVETRIPLPLTYGETYLLVAKIVAGQANPDQVFLRVYGPQEPVEPEEPGSWTMVGREFHSDLVFDWLELHINSISRKVLDEIRVGTTWSSVAGPWMQPGANDE